ncbi:glycosyltransferase family 2 protein [Patescibacteria group bacterium]|nr:glycosyltransferase family 2 protein [Patescibacteria group bacterium]
MYDLSILIPARNEEFLVRTIDDILQHIEGNTEIIVGCDGNWPATPIKDNPRVTVVHVSESIGQRAMTNQLCRLSKAKYVMKVDAHCAFDQGFDVKLMADMHDDWTVAPIMRNLHAFNWKCKNGHTRYQSPSGVCKVCGEPTEKDVVWIAKTNPSSTSYCFDPEPHFQYFNDCKNRQWYKDQGDLTESMSLQGSCFMLTRDKYWELNICDENFGNWGSQGIEVACKTWLSGGRVIINHKTWYAHLFRTQGGDFGFPYLLGQGQISNAKKTAREMFFDGRFKGERPISWLVEKFWPVPKWTEDDLKKIGGKVPVVEKTSSTEPIVKLSGTKGVIYYTDNQLDEKVMKACQKQLWKSACRDHKLPIVSCSLKPMDFGKNKVFKGERGYLTMTKQILTALEELDTDIVFFCEHDVLYPPEHFAFTPPDRNTWYYEENYWFLRLNDGFAISYDCSPLSGLVVYRDIAIKHFKERIALMEKDQFKEFSMLKIGFEPMTHGRIKWENSYPFKTFYSPKPSIDITHGSNVSRKRWRIDQFRRKPKRWQEGTIDTISEWDNVKRLLG